MTSLVVERLSDASVRTLSQKRDAIQINPPYQRQGEIWPLDRKRLLIDSILRGYDIPKLYFRRFVPAELIEDRLVSYAVIDGRQRLETIWAFVDDRLVLEYEDFAADLGLIGLPDPVRFSDLRTFAPQVARQFMNYQIDVVTIETSDLDIIEDMFLRLNEAAPLNAAEKRNAFGGPIPPAYKRVVTHPFFVDRLPFENNRYRHYDMATKFMYFEHRNGVADTKKTYLDRFVKDAKNRKVEGVGKWESAAMTVLEGMAHVFKPKDPLLTTVGMSSVYYLLFRQSMADGWQAEITREKLATFEQKRYDNRKLAANVEEAFADYDLLEFDRYAQSPNDAVALRFRRNVLLEYFEHPVEPAGEDE